MSEINLPTTTLATNEQHIAALDIGSNSFHFVLARVNNENLQILHSEKYQVRLADGLSDEYILSEEAIVRGLQALQRLAPTVANITQENFRVVATYTLRRAKNSHEFLARAAQVFPYDIEVISGHEEARLVYLGASHYLPTDEKRLVIDVGGGSTECIIGQGDKIFTLESFNMGCVSWAIKYFPQQKISAQAFNNATLNACSILDSIKGRFLRTNWQVVTGTSGTIKSIYHIINSGQELTKPINLSQLLLLKKKLLGFATFDDIELQGLKENRRAVICSGLSILIALFKSFELKELNFCDYSLREGVIFEELEQRLTSDIHQRTIASLITRFNIDVEQTNRVTSFAELILNSVSEQWGIGSKTYKDILKWSITLHEIGVDINTSSYHKHGKYIIENIDLPGFNQEQTQALAWLVGCHRKKIISTRNYPWYLLKPEKLSKILVIIRLACLFYKQRQLTHCPELLVSATESGLTLALQEAWRLNNPIILSELSKEIIAFEQLNIQFQVN